MSVISVEEGEYKNGDVLYIVDKNEEEARWINKEVTDEEIVAELDVLLKAIIL